MGAGVFQFLIWPDQDQQHKVFMSTTHVFFEYVSATTFGLMFLSNVDNLFAWLLLAATLMYIVGGDTSGLQAPFMQHQPEGCRYYLVGLLFNLPHVCRGRNRLLMSAKTAKDMDPCRQPGLSAAW